MKALSHILSYITIFSFVFSIDPPQNLEAVGGSGEIQLQWDSVEGATSYGVYQVLEDATTTTTSGGCDAGYVEDCSGDGDCCPESWIGDGFEDCEDQAYGCDLTCYDDDGGDCSGATTTDDGGTTATTSGGCDAGYVEDCSGDGDCCPEGWIGDGYEDCEDQAYGCDLTCYDNDGGDCAPACPDGEVECWDGSCAADESYCPDAPDCGASFTVLGSDPSIGDCYSDGSGYFWLNWEGGCLALTVNGQDISSYNFTAGFYYTGFPGGSTETFEITFDGGSSGSGAATNDCASCEDQGLVECDLDGSCAASYDDCPQGCSDLGAYVDNCSPDVEGASLCCPESWIGDGYADCEDQAYGCDLTCYDNDGGDCGGVLSDNSGSNEKQIPGAPQLVAMNTNVKDVNDVVHYNRHGSTYYGGTHASDSREESGYSDIACATTLGETDPCDGWGPADVNNDAILDVLDIVLMVNHILEESYLDGCPLESSDSNGDGNVDVLDIVFVVNAILGEKSTSSAKSIKFNKENDGIVMSADGFVAVIDVMLSHSEDFIFDKVSCESNSFVCGFNTSDNSTRVIIVNPYGNTLFTAEGEFEIVSAKAAGSNGYIDVATVKAYSVSNSYPNPFNPSTSFSLELSSAADVSVNVYNIMGQLVDVLAEGNLSAQTHNFTWNAEGLSSGVYFIKTQVGADIHTQKVMLMK